MEEYVILGSIFKVSYEAIAELLREVLGEIRTNDDLFGEQILFQNENFRIFFDNSHDYGRDWALNANFKGTLEDLTELLSKITQKLIDAGFNYDIGYYKIDAEGNEVGEEVSLYHPDYHSHDSPPSSEV